MPAWDRSTNNVSLTLHRKIFPISSQFGTSRRMLSILSLFVDCPCSLPVIFLPITTVWFGPRGPPKCFFKSLFLSLYFIPCAPLPPTDAPTASVDWYPETMPLSMISSTAKLTTRATTRSAVATSSKTTRAKQYRLSPKQSQQRKQQ